MRLIDADALVEEIKNKFPMGGTRGVFLAFVDDAPTAYDVEKVVVELKKESYQEFCDSPKIIDLKDAIDIVENGGI